LLDRFRGQVETSDLHLGLVREAQPTTWATVIIRALAQIYALPGPRFGWILDCSPGFPLGAPESLRRPSARGDKPLSELW
jgi:hypothetical protein